MEWRGEVEEGGGFGCLGKCTVFRLCFGLGSLGCAIGFRLEKGGVVVVVVEGGGGGEEE